MYNFVTFLFEILINLLNMLLNTKLEKILQNYNKFDEILKSFPEIKNEPIAYSTYNYIYLF